MAVITIYGIFAANDVTDENKVIKACAFTRFQNLYCINDIVNTKKVFAL